MVVGYQIPMRNIYQHTAEEVYSNNRHSSTSFQMFQRIREEKPEVLKKLIPVQGDVTFDGLGLSAGPLLNRVLESTNIVFHLAATLRLEANLKDAIDMNTTGTKRVIALCHDMSNLQLLVHLSTAFAYCDKEVLYEKVFDCAQNPHDLIRCAEWMDVKTLENITPNLMHPHPNTYTYSKRLAEMLIRDEHDRLPVAIARPSIGECFMCIREKERQRCEFNYLFTISDEL